MTAAVDVVVGIPMRDGKVLLCQRKPGKRYELLWEFPGGKLEPGETHEQALERELLEEIGVRPLASTCIRTKRAVYPDGGVFNVVFYLVEELDGEPQNLDFNEVRWVEPREFGEYDILEGSMEICSFLQQQYGVKQDVRQQ